MLINAYRQAQDIHRITASQVFHVPFDEVTDLQRRNAKAVNFGIVYGISSFGLSQDLSISRKEAAEYIDQYFLTYPGIKTFLDNTVASAQGTWIRGDFVWKKTPDAGAEVVQLYAEIIWRTCGDECADSGNSS